MRTPKNEPVVTSATISGLISAALVMLVALNIIKLDNNQMIAIGGFLALAAPIAISFWPRSVVTPVAEPQVVAKSGETVDLVRADGKALEA